MLSPSTSFPSWVVRVEAASDALTLSESSREPRRPRPTAMYTKPPKRATATRTSAATHTPKRTRKDRARSLPTRGHRIRSALAPRLSRKPVTYSADGLDQLGLETIVHLSTKVPDVDIHRVRLVEHVIVPNVLGDHGA